MQKGIAIVNFIFHIAGRIHGHFQQAVFVAIRRQCRHRKVTDMIFGAEHQIHIPENTAPAELVLILQIAAITELQHQHRDAVAAGTDKFGDIEFTGGMADLIITDKGAVDPQVHAGIHALKVDIDLAGKLIFRQRKVTDIAAAGVVDRHIRRVIAERETVIGIHIPVVAPHLPGRRHIDPVKTGHIIAIPIEFLRQIIDPFVITEGPIPVQQQRPVASITGAVSKGIRLPAMGNEVGPIRLGVQPENGRIFKIIFHDHGFHLEGVISSATGVQSR